MPIKKQWFKATTKNQKPLVNESDGIISNVSVCSVGEASGHYVWLDEAFIGDVAKLGNEMSIGVKCRFGHPNMSNEALGTYLGRFKNFRVSDDKQKVLADLEIDPTAYNTPNGDLGGYVLSLAKTSPEMFGSSIVFSVASEYYKRADNGEKVSRQEYWRDEVTKEELELDGNELKTYISIKNLFGTDIVDEPAANNGLFSAKFNAQSFAVIATQFLDENPEIAQFVNQNPEKIVEFISRYQSNQEQPERELDAAAPEENNPSNQEQTEPELDAAVPEENNPSYQELLTALRGQEDSFSKWVELFTARINDLESRVTIVEDSPATTDILHIGSDSRSNNRELTDWEKKAQDYLLKNK